jgi:hypothetical protein
MELKPGSAWLVSIPNTGTTRESHGLLCRRPDGSWQLSGGGSSCQAFKRFFFPVFEEKRNRMVDGRFPNTRMVMTENDFFEGCWEFEVILLSEWDRAKPRRLPAPVLVKFSRPRYSSCECTADDSICGGLIRFTCGHVTIETTTDILEAVAARLKRTANHFEKHGPEYADRATAFHAEAAIIEEGKFLWEPDQRD